MERTAKQIRDAGGVTVDPAIPDDEIVSPLTHRWIVDTSRILDAVPTYSVIVKRKA